MIEVGEYVRDKKGYIHKAKSVYKDMIWWCDLSWIAEKDIVKHSKNIIDLIEEGDYVNGHKVKGIDEDGDIFIEIPFENNSGYRLINKIKSIVTKEQFAQMEYKLKE